MATEIKPLTDARWPASVRLPVALTFEHQSGEGAPLLPGDRPNAMIGGAMQYGARTGIWNILELLDAFAIKATFLVCGTTAEKYPDAIRAAHQAGHEIGGMGHSFDRVRTMSVERERGVVRRAVKALQDASGARINGWRCPDYRVSPQTLDVLSEDKPVLMPLTVHDFIVGRPSRSSVLDQFIPYAKEHEGVVFATHDQVREWWLRNYENDESRTPGRKV